MVAMHFTFALFENDFEMAKFLSVSDQWPQIDEWINQHSVDKCSFEWDLDIGPWGIGGGRGVDEFDYFYQIPCSGRNGYYYFSVDMHLRKTNEGWKVAFWQLCEDYNFSSEACPIGIERTNDLPLI